MTTQGFLRHIHNCTRYDPEKFLPFFVDGTSLGFVTREVIALLSRNNSDFLATNEGLVLNPDLNTFETRTAALERATDILSHHYKTARRNEMYPVIQKWGDAPFAQLDRGALKWFGTCGFGLHVNGFVQKADGIHIWIAKRSSHLLVEPGKLDHIVAGGSPIGLTMEENLIKEAWEEAGLDARTVSTARFVGTLAYKMEMGNGLRNDSIHIYDLELPEDTVPQSTDGEVEYFTLMPVTKVAAIVHDTDNFKTNCNLVIIDFLLRHGFIGTSHPEYAAVSNAINALR